MSHFPPMTTSTIKKRRPTSSSSSSSSMSSKVNGTMKLSTDPQSVAARERRHRISDRFKILQSLVPGGAKMDTVSLLEEAINYVKFLKTQIWLHHNMIVLNSTDVVHDRTVRLAPPDHHLAAHSSSTTLYGVPQPAQPQADTYFQTHEATLLGCSEYWKF